jgi:hypothetical protein
MAIILTRKPETVDVPEEDIQEVIIAVKNYLENYPNKTECTVGMFGHKCYKVNAATIEHDVREAAKTATEYTKV